MARSELRAYGSRIDPGTGKLSHLPLRAWRWIAALSRLPAPRNSVISCQMLIQQLECAPPVSLWVFELLAYF